MIQLFIKYAVTAALVVAIAELGKRSSWLGAALAAIPVTSLLAFIWLHAEGAGNSAIATMSMQIVWLVIASLPLFLLLAWLLNRGVGFWTSLGISAAVTCALYLTVVWMLIPVEKF
jgi:hypothetical protein